MNGCQGWQYHRAGQGGGAVGGGGEEGAVVGPSGRLCDGNLVGDKAGREVGCEGIWNLHQGVTGAL